MKILQKVILRLVLKKALFWVLVFVVFCGLIDPVSANTISLSTYFVSPIGSNSNPGTFAQPWKTLAYAVDQIHAGDTLNIRGGTYRERFLWISNSGNPYSSIVLTNYNGEEVVIDGLNNTIPSHGSGGSLIGVFGD